MKAFDFDKTIYDGDSTVDFYFYALAHRKAVIKSLPNTLVSGARYLFGSVDKTEFKESFFGFLKYIDDIDEFVEEFWNERIDRIKDWYLNMRRGDDVVISASPEFLLDPVCRRLSVGKLIASRVDKKTGKYDGRNCDGEEKARRYKAVYGNKPPDEFYSDSYNDTPMAKLAYNALYVHGNDIREWDRKELREE